MIYIIYSIIISAILTIIYLKYFQKKIIKISKNYIFEQFNNIVIYVITDSENNLLLINNKDTKNLLNLYMTESDIKNTIDGIQNKFNSNLKIIPLPLSYIIKNLEDNPKYKDYSIKIIPRKEMIDKANSLMDNKIDVPVFLTNPPININDKKKNKDYIALFFDFEQYETFLAKIKNIDTEHTIVIIDFMKLLNLIINDKKNKYYFLPTLEYLNNIDKFIK